MWSATCTSVFMDGVQPSSPIRPSGDRPTTPVARTCLTPSGRPSLALLGDGEVVGQAPVEAEFGRREFDDDRVLAHAEPFDEDSDRVGPEVHRLPELDTEEILPDRML